ncbi:MAG: hypothetical protein JNL21_15015 [Myxococcales bacterium]|nr:hypothetical protein [Myxococcales bacterium]
MAIEIREVRPGGDVDDFLKAGHVVFAGDPAWVPPLEFDIRGRLNPKKNPLFLRADVTLFCAYKDGKLVGRCSATVDREHLRLWKDDTGFFGFLDTIDDQEVADALLRRAETWLRDKGMKRAMGPMSLYANDEIGCLIEGFEHPPVIMMGHSREYQAKLIEGAGYAKEKDLWAWRYHKDTPFNDRTLRAWESIRAIPEMRLRSIDMKNFARDVRTIIEIYNDAWAGKWGFVPATGPEVDKMVEELRLVLDPDIAFMAELDGHAVGMCIMVPNLNEAIADLNGKLFPFGWAKLLYRTKVKVPKSTRLILLGIRGEARKNVKKYGGLSAAMYVEVAKRGIAKGYEWSELGWTREDDSPINLGIRSMGAKVYKKYRVFKKDL